MNLSKVQAVTLISDDKMMKIFLNEGKNKKKTDRPTKENLK